MLNASGRKKVVVQLGLFDELFFPILLYNNFKFEKEKKEIKINN